MGEYTERKGEQIRTEVTKNNFAHFVKINLPDLSKIQQ